MPSEEEEKANADRITKQAKMILTVANKVTKFALLLRECLPEADAAVKPLLPDRFQLPEIRTKCSMRSLRSSVTKRSLRKWSRA